MLGIPRGGVIVAAEVARALAAPLDVIVPRKIGAPGQPELAIAALALAGGEEILIADEGVGEQLGVTREYLAKETTRQRGEIERREALYRRGRAAPAIAGRIVLVVDDGLATGLTVRAACEALRRGSPKELIVAAPVAPVETSRDFRAHGLRLELLHAAEFFSAVGQFYTDFAEVSDQAVEQALASAARREA